MKNLFFFCALLVLLIGSSVALKPNKQQQQRKSNAKLDCNTLRSTPNLLNPVLCLSDDEVKNLGSRGREWRKQNGAVEFEPVILIPGLAGSALEAKLHESAKPPHVYCYKNHAWYQTWLALLSMLPGEQDCWWHNMDVFYNTTSDSFYNQEGVEVRPMDFGGMKGIDYLDHDDLGNGISATAYYAPLIADLVAAGFKVGQNLFGAPYDWRRGDHVPDFRANLKQLVEKAYTSNGNKQVHIVAHSMGNLQTGVFLSEMTQEWKDKFIGSFVAVAGPWSGAPMALRTIVSGNNLGATFLGMNLIDPLRVRQLARQAGGVIWCMPDIEFWNTTEIIKTPTGSYNAETLPTLFAQLGTSVTAEIADKMVRVHDIPAPNVELHCLYGTDFPTEMHYTYNNGFDKDPEIKYDNDGDGVVPAQSLQKCQEFAKKQKQPVEVKEFDLAGHMNILYDEELLQYILKLVSIPVRK